MVKFDNRKLRGKIKEIYGTQGTFAKEMGLSERSMSLKLNGQIVFSQSEIAKAVQLLGIEEGKISEFFFNPIVQKNELRKRKVPNYLGMSEKYFAGDEKGG